MSNVKWIDGSEHYYACDSSSLTTQYTVNVFKIVPMKGKKNRLVKPFEVKAENQCIRGSAVCST